MTRQLYTRATFLVVTVTTLALGEQPVEWNRFRGPNGTGIAHHVNFPDSWEVKDYAWRIELPGRGVSSPVLWRAIDGKETLFVQGGSKDGNSRYLRCIDASNGKTIWEKKHDFAKLKTHGRNSLGSSTPAVDSSGVYTTFGDGKQYTLTKYDLSGERLWERELGPFICNHGAAFSPVLIADMVVCSLQQPVGGENVATVLHTFDRASGEPGWRTTMTAHAKASFSAPCFRTLNDGTTEIVCVNSGNGVFGVNPENGEEKWSRPVFTMRTVSSPVIAGDVILGSTGSGGGGNYVVAVKPTPDGGVEEVYRVSRQAPYVPTPIYHDGLVFLWSDKGIGTCIDAETGAEIWKERLSGDTGASPICIGDRIMGVSEAGEVVVIAASREFRKIGGGPLGEASQSTPAVGAKHIYFRSDTHLMALGGQ